MEVIFRQGHSARVSASHQQSCSSGTARMHKGIGSAVTVQAP